MRFLRAPEMGHGFSPCSAAASIPAPQAGDTGSNPVKEICSIEVGLEAAIFNE